MAYERIVLTREGSIATLTLRQPETRNSMTPEMGDEVSQAVDELAADTSIRIVILTGAGKAFSSGGDLNMLARDSGVTTSAGPTMGAAPRQFYDRYLAIRQLPMPTLAAINGHAIGAGLCIALACDLRVAVADAKMGMTFTRLGLHPGMGATYALPRLIGVARAAELFFTGRVIDAVEAERLGIVNHAVPRAEFPAVIRSLAEEIARAAPFAVRMVKKAIYRGIDQPLEEMLDYEALSQRLTLTTADAREGLRAIREKRTPSFTGR